MKKLFKWFFSIIAIIIVLALITGLFLPTEYHVERTKTINASYEEVYSQVSSLNKMTNWSPWVDYDPEMKITYEGEEGTVGSIYNWEGNEDVGSGYQEILEISDFQTKFEVVFIEPRSDKAIATIDLEETEDGINVTWGLDGKMPYPMNIMATLFMNMDEMLGADFERGLTKLDSICALNINQEPKTYRGFDISEIDYGPKTFVGYRSTIKFEEIQDFYATHFGALYSYYMPKGIEIDGYPSGMYLSYNEEQGEAEMIAAIPINNSDIEIPDGYELIEANGKALFIEYVGAYNKSGDAHWAMDDYMKEMGLELNTLVIEEYVNDPGSEPDTSKWITNIIYLIK